MLLKQGIKQLVTRVVNLTVESHKPRRPSDRSYLLLVATNSSNAVLDRVLGAVGECLDREGAEALLRLRADAEMQGRIEALADKCTDGSLSPEEPKNMRL